MRSSMVSVRLDDMLVELLWVEQGNDRGVLEEAYALGVAVAVDVLLLLL